MNQEQILELILHDGGMTQFTDQRHPDFNVDNSLLLVEIKPDLFTLDQITKLKITKELDSYYQTK